ncbi:MAG TPA: M56 family metallopeptidase [Actinomycetota bacterium]|nr:M56 family metallopeptidase [Actinomycetota bacterium]
MTRLGVLLAALAAFMIAPRVLERLRSAPPRWRVRLAFLTILGMGASSVSLLAVVLFPEALLASRMSDMWHSEAIHDLVKRPPLRAASIAAGVILVFVLLRFLWCFVRGARSTSRARVPGGGKAWRLSEGESVFVLPVGAPMAYSLGRGRGQVVVSQGLFGALDPAELRAVLLHEEGHVRSHDHGKILLVSAIRGALGLLPSVGAAVEALEQAMEEAADEHAARRLGDPAVVATALSKAALSGLQTPPGMLGIISETDVLGRVRRLLEPPRVPEWMPWACVAVTGALLAFLALTQVMVGVAVLAATHHLVSAGAVAVFPLPPAVRSAAIHALA